MQHKEGISHALPYHKQPILFYTVLPRQSINLNPHLIPIPSLSDQNNNHDGYMENSLVSVTSLPLHLFGHAITDKPVSYISADRDCHVFPKTT